MTTKTEKSKLKYAKKTVYEVDSSDLEAYIEQYYGQRYDYTTGEDVGNYSSLTFEVDPEELLHYEFEDLETFKETGEGSLLTQIFLIDLCNRGLIPCGEYLIYAEW